MINSDTFGMTFWLDDDNEFCYCPTFTNNTPDLHNWGYVSEWMDLEGVNLSKLLDIHKSLLLNKETK
mgnify:FL=1